MLRQHKKGTDHVFGMFSKRGLSPFIFSIGLNFYRDEGFVVVSGVIHFAAFPYDDSLRSWPCNTGRRMDIFSVVSRFGERPEFSV